LTYIVLDITCKSGIPKTLQFKGVHGETLQSKSRWIFPNIFRYQSLEVKTMIGNHRPDQLDMSTSVVRWIIRDLVKNTVFLFRTLFHTYRFEILVNTSIDLPLSIDSNVESAKIWVSRHSLWVGLQPTDLEGTLEEERLKNPLQFSCMVRSADQISPPMSLNYEMYEQENYSLEQIDTAAYGSGKFFVESQTLNDAQIIHARVVVVGSQVLQMSNKRTPLMSRSPSFIDEIEGSYRAFKLFHPALEVENGLYIGTATNWFHFIVELAVRIGSIPKELYVNKPIIIELGAHKNILRLCYLMTGVEPIEVAVGQSIRVSSLTVLREFGVKDPIDPVQRTGELKEFARKISERVPNSDKAMSPKLFFRRPAHLYRPLQNEKKVAKYLESKGFESVYPEQYSLDDFITLLRGADFVIAESGAAITNMMFAKSSTKFLEITPALVTPEFWRDFIEVFEQEYFGIHGSIARFGSKGYAYDGYKIAVADLKEILQNWGIR
jgi:hypothetical protein